MQVTYKTRNGQIAITAQGETVKALFKEVASIIEVFDSDKECGKCRGKEIAPRVRTIDKDCYYEIACLNRECRATLSLGQTKEGGMLFVKRKDKNDEWLPNGGWTIYSGKQQQQDADPEPRQQQQSRGSNSGGGGWPGR